MKANTYLTTAHLEAGTVAYMAPECFTHDYGISEKADVYSLGIILWECVTGQRPWCEYGHQMAIIYQVVSCDRRPSLDLCKSVDCPESLRRLIKSCWARNPKERPSSGDVARRLEIILKQQQL